MRVRSWWLCAAALVLSACVEQGVAPPEAGDLDLGEQALQAQDVAGFYTLEHDFRRCISPLCGGYWVKSVNHRETRCADGSLADRCYVAEVQWDELGLSDEQLDEVRFSLGALLIQGRLGKKSYDNFGNLGDLRPRRAFMAVNDQGPGGAFWRTEDLGIRCFTEPCVNKRSSLLNSLRSWRHAGLDLRRVDATGDQLAAAYEALGADDLVTTGYLVRDRPTRANPMPGLTLVATQIYLPISAQECVADEGCTMSPYTAPVNGPEDCYCPMCGIPMSTAEARINGDGWQRHCPDLRMFCPLPPCAAPPPVGCVDNQCGFVPDF